MIVSAFIWAFPSVVSDAFSIPLRIQRLLLLVRDRTTLRMD
jgi:hypothetical protein